MTLSDRVLSTIVDQGPLSDMHLAAELDESYRSIRGAALHLIRNKRARWFRGKLQPLTGPSYVDRLPNHCLPIVPPHQTHAFAVGMRVRADLPVGSMFVHRIVGTIDWVDDDGVHCIIRKQSVYAFARDHEQAGRILPTGEIECVELTQIIDF